MAFQAGFERVEPRIELPERSRCELHMSESVAIKRVDNLLRHIGDDLRGRPATDQKLVGPARKLPLGFRWISLEIVRGEQLDEPPVTNNSGGERGRVEWMAAEPRKQALGQPIRQPCQARGDRQYDKRDDETSNADKSANGRKMKHPREAIFEKPPQVFVLIADFLQESAHRRVEQAVLTFAVESDDIEHPDMADRIGDRAECAG